MSELPFALRRAWPWLAGGVALRAGFAWKLGERLYQVDESAYRYAAWQLLTTRSLALDGQAIVIPPVPVGLFAAMMGPFQSLFWPRLAQGLVNVAACWALGRMAESLSGSRLAGRLALAIGCVYPFFVYYSGMLLTESLNVSLAIFGLWWLTDALGRRDPPDWQPAAGGLALSLAALCRAEAAFIMLPVWAAAALLCAKGRWHWRAWMLGLCVWALPLGLWCARNKAATGAFALDTHGGMALLHGGMFYELNYVDTALAQKAIEQTEFWARAQALPERERDRVFKSEALRFMRENPGRTLKQWAHKLAQFWRFYPRVEKPYLETPQADASAGASRSLLVLISLLFEPALILGGLAGLWAWRGRWRQLFPLYLWTLGTMAVHVVSVSQMRYRLPVMPVLIVAACSWAAARLKR